jgi:hypothetical protein
MYGHAAMAEMRCHRADVDDLPPIPLLQLGMSGTAQHENRGQIGVDDLVPEFERDLQRVLRCRRNPSVQMGQFSSRAQASTCQS